MKIHIILPLLFVSIVCFGQSQKTSQWLEDIAVLEQEMPKIHINLFHSLSQKEFTRMINDLRANVNQWHDYKIISEIQRIVGMLNDGHSQISMDSFDSTKVYSFHYFPIKFQVFDDGLYIVKTTPEWKHLIGSKLISINNTSAETAYKLLTPLVPRDNDNEYAVKEGTRFIFSCVETLYGLGIINNTKEALYTLQNSAKETIQVKLKAVPTSSYFQTFRPESEDNLPLARQFVNMFYWSKYLSDQKTLYIRYIYMVNNPNEKLAAFVAKLQRMTDSLNIEKVVVDVRNGQGGNINTINPMIDFLTQEKINQPGKLFALMDRGSVSAHTVFLNRLEFNSQAIFMGEPNTNNPNFYSDSRSFILPNSKLKINLSSVFLQESLNEDKRIFISPHIRIPILSTDYFSMKDPVLEAALNYQITKKPSTTTCDITVVIGKYDYSLLKTLVIKKNQAGVCQLIINNVSTPYLSTTLHNDGANKWKTDITGLTLRYDTRVKQLILNFHGTERGFPRKDAQWQSLPDLLIAGDHEKFINEVRSKNLNKTDQQLLESYLNRSGYDFLNKNEFKKAINIFEVNTKLFPASSNAFDSLGEGYMKSGDNASAIIQYKKAIELNPNNDNAKKTLSQLQKN